MKNKKTDWVEVAVAGIVALCGIGIVTLIVVCIMSAYSKTANADPIKKSNPIESTRDKAEDTAFIYVYPKPFCYKHITESGYISEFTNAELSGWCCSVLWRNKKGDLDEHEVLFCPDNNNYCYEETGNRCKI